MDSASHRRIKKKGQMTYFIIIGIILLIFASFGFYLMFSDRNETVGINTIDTVPIQQYVDSCLKNTLYDAVDYVSLQGGYYITPEPNIKNLGWNIPYYHYQNRYSEIYADTDLVPTISTIEAQIGLFIMDRIEYCIADFAPFSQQGYLIDGGEITVEVTMAQDKVTAYIDYPIAIGRGTQQTSIKNFRSDIQSPLEFAHGIASLYIARQKETPDEEPISYLMDLAYENNFHFENIFRGDSYIYGIITESIDLQKTDDYVFVFAVRYDWSDLEAIQ